MGDGHYWLLNNNYNGFANTPRKTTWEPLNIATRTLGLTLSQSYIWTTRTENTTPVIPFTFNNFHNTDFKYKLDGDLSETLDMKDAMTPTARYSAFIENPSGYK